MHHVLPRSFWPLAAGPLMLAVALLVCTMPLHAQQAPSRGASGSGYGLRQFEKDLKEAEDHDPSTGRVVRFFKGWAGLVIIAVAVGVLVIAFKVGIWFLSRMTATTNPDKLALSDPWVRAHLAQQAAKGNEPPLQGQS